MKTYVVPVSKTVETFVYIKAEDEAEAYSKVQEMKGIIAVRDDMISTLDPFNLGNVGEDVPT